MAAIDVVSQHLEVSKQCLSSKLLVDLKVPNILHGYQAIQPALLCIQAYDASTTNANHSHTIHIGSHTISDRGFKVA